MYTKDRLIALNPSYNVEHRVTDADVAKINQLVSLIEAARQGEPTRPIDGDRIICVSPEKGVVSRHGHIQKRMSMGYWMTICTDPYTPFIDEELESDASGGYWIVVQEKDIPSFTYVGTHGSVIFRLVLKNQHRAGHTALATSPRVLRGAVAPLIAA